MADDDNHANVFKKPENAEEADACQEAFEGCFSAACGRVFFL